MLTRYLRAKLVEFNPGLPTSVYEDAVQQIVATSAAKSTLQHNEEKYALFRDGVPVTWMEAGMQRAQRLRVFDFTEPTNNHFLAVRGSGSRGPIHRCRPDLIGFVNGIPLLFVERKRHYRDARRL